MDKEYFKNQFRTASIRLGHWNYASPGLYSITICTHDRQCCLSEIKDDRVILSEIGEIVFDDLMNIPKLRSYVLVDDYVIMPNHIHIIFVLTDANDFGHPDGRDAVNRVSTVREFGGLQPKSLAAIVNAFKGGVTRRCHENNLDFHWQSNYYEHIIRDEDDYVRIKEYIFCNPGKWADDRSIPKNIK
ncbi:MAG: hypothetical protein NTX82_07485 [Candidatus Parcubacteria bacterium]|nr:hypothetical protein [Candidatus Parcubacteria bacterium]